MERSLEDGDEYPDSQGHATDWRFAVCSLRDAWEEEDPASQKQIRDPSPPRPPAQGEGLQGSPLPRDLQLPSELQATNGSGDGQKSTLGGASVQSEEPFPSGVESLLCPMSSHLSLAQGESDSPRGGLLGDPGPGEALPAVLGPGGLDSNPVDPLGDPLSETSSKLMEAGKGG